jgi:hypothetical protein
MAFRTTADSFRLLKEGGLDFTYVIVTSSSKGSFDSHSHGILIGNRIGPLCPCHPSDRGEGTRVSRTAPTHPLGDVRRQVLTLPCSGTTAGIT